MYKYYFNYNYVFVFLSAYQDFLTDFVLVNNVTNSNKNI